MYVFYTDVLPKSSAEKEKLILKAISMYCESCYGPAYECACCRGCGIADAERMPELAKTEKGKPYFVGNNMPEISITHSGKYYLCAIAPFGVGIDLEINSRPEAELEKTAKRFFTGEELHYMKDEGRDLKNSFYRMWVRKEAYTKYIGNGIMDNLSGFSTVVKGEMISYAAVSDISGKASSEVCSFVESDFFEGYSFCACMERTEEVKFIKL